MNIQRLFSNDVTSVQAYIDKKFKEYNGTFYPKATRKKKCIEYYLAAQGSPHGQKVIKDRYGYVFKEAFPVADAERIAEVRSRQPIKIASQDKQDLLYRRLAHAETVLETLRVWKEKQKYQMGEDFFLQLQAEVEPLGGSLLSESSFESEFNVMAKKLLTGKVESTSTSRSASFEAMIGIQQHARIEFEAASVDWGTINAKLEQSFKAGAWGKGSAKAEMTRLGFNLEAQLAVAIGAELTVDASCKWKQGMAGLELAGNGRCFVGAEANIGGKLSVNALKGINACLEAGAFAGFKAEASGSCSFTYGDKTLVGLKASAAVTFGAGASFKAELASQIFGPTTVSFAANLTVGLGSETSTTVAIDFSEIYLAGSEQFKKLVYLPTLARGYQMDLMTSDSRNLFYLNKCIDRVGKQIADLQDSVDTYDSTPMEKRALLATVD